MAQYSSYESLFAALLPAINTSLKTAVAPVIKTTESEVVKDVLDEYHPSVYQHRTTGGLDDVANMVDTVKNGVLTVTNQTEFNDDYNSTSSGVGLAGLVEYGDGWNGFQYDYMRGDNYEQFSKPRDITERTKEKLVDEGKYIEAFKDGLRIQGFEVK